MSSLRESNCLGRKGDSGALSQTKLKDEKHPKPDSTAYLNSNPKVGPAGDRGAEGPTAPPGAERGWAGWAQTHLTFQETSHPKRPPREAWNWEGFCETHTGERGFPRVTQAGSPEARGAAFLQGTRGLLHWPLVRGTLALPPEARASRASVCAHGQWHGERAWGKGRVRRPTS